jgi:hypothetical protein
MLRMTVVGGAFAAGLTYGSGLVGLYEGSDELFRQLASGEEDCTDCDD